ncbi:MAG: DUF1343 domain-containing protein [Bacteroidota bacterium]
MIEYGIDHLLSQDPSWKNQRIALLTNYAATSNKGVPTRKALLDHGYKLQLLFSPEHGLDTKGEDGKQMPDGFDQLTGLPVISLYGKKLAPDEKDLAEIDLVLFDVPDIGARFYTYLSTLTYLLEACAKFEKKLIILDRPNPISGNMSLSEGPTLQDSVASFIGRWSIPIRHSCTLGELASYFISTRNIKVDFSIILCRNWNRNEFQPDWGTDFVATSPAIQHFDSMLLYPGLCLLEATNISEGRGTDRAFSIAGAPWMSGRIIANLFNQLGLEDIKAKAISFKPTHGKYEGQICEGVEFMIQDRNYFQSVSNGLLLINLIKSIYPKQFAWANYPTAINPTGSNHLDKLLGLENSELLFNLPLQQFLPTVIKITNTNQWQKEIAPFLIY